MVLQFLRGDNEGLERLDDIGESPKGEPINIAHGGMRSRRYDLPMRMIKASGERSRMRLESEERFEDVESRIL